MHNAAFQTLGLDYTYVPFRVKSLELKKAIEGIRGLNLRGLNVTIPHKVAVMQFLDRIDPWQKRSARVNTIVNERTASLGYNTDATGLQTLHDKDVDPEDKEVLCWGQVGHTAIGNVLAGEKARITILNRRQELSWAEDLAHLAHSSLRS